MSDLWFYEWIKMSVERWANCQNKEFAQRSKRSLSLKERAFWAVRSLSDVTMLSFFFGGGGFLDFFPMYCVQHCFICRPSDSTVSEDAGMELLPWQSESSNHSARSPSQNRRIAYQENDEGRSYTCISTDVLMYLNMNLYQSINVLLYRLFI
jgi:hypothetical protein